MTYIPNPMNYPMVNHKDRDVTNNAVQNLEWCTLEYNNKYTFSIGEKMKGCRNNLYVNNCFIKQFNSISEAAHYCVEHYDCDYNHICNFLTDKKANVYIERLDKAIDTYMLYKGNLKIKEFRYGKDAYKYVKNTYGCTISSKKMFNVAQNILLIKNESTTPDEFWRQKENKHYNPTIYSWDLYDNGRFIKSFEGKKSAVEYARKNYNISNYQDLLYRHKYKELEIKKGKIISK